MKAWDFKRIVLDADNDSEWVPAEVAEALRASLKESSTQVAELCQTFSVPLPQASLDRYKAALEAIDDWDET